MAIVGAIVYVCVTSNNRYYATLGLRDAKMSRLLISNVSIVYPSDIQYDKT